jgi:anti-anti-sigma factor
MEKFTIEQTGKECCAVMTGDFTVEVIADLQAALKQTIEKGVSTLTFDFGRTTLLDSSGIGLIIATSNSLAKTGGKVRLVNVNRDILQLLTMMRLTSRIEVSARAL